MKKIGLYSLLAVCLLAAEPALAQKSKVTTAIISLRNNDIEKAEESINEAAENEATKADPKTWLTRGQVYKAIYTTPKLRANSPNALDEAYKSFAKGLELDTRGKMFELKDEMKDLTLLFYDQASAAYNKQQYDVAFKNFDTYLSAMSKLDDSRRKEIEDLLKQNKIDPLAAKLYAGYSAQQMKDSDKAIKYYNELVSAKYNEPLVYMYLSDIYKAKGDTAKAIETLDKGLAGVTEKKGLLIDKLNIYITRGQTEEALKLGLDALKLDPENTSLMIAMGNIYDNQKMTKEAQDMYNKALAKDPNDLNTNYSIGISYFNLGAAKYNESTEIRDVKKSNAKLAEAKENFKQSITYLEKALAADPKDPKIKKDILGSLAEMYAKLDNFDKSAEYRNMQKAVK